jgi:hypothetical protein
MKDLMPMARPETTPSLRKINSFTTIKAFGGSFLSAGSEKSP